MPYADTHVLLRITGYFGTLAGPQDRWSVGLRFGTPGTDVPLDPAALQAFVNAANEPVATFHGAAGNGVGGACYYEYVTGARIGPDGKYSPSLQETLFGPQRNVPGNGTTNQPWNTAAVISLRTIAPRGYASNGRVYYPATSLPITPTTGRIQSTAVTSRLAAFKVLVDALNTAAASYSPNMKLMVASNVGAGVSRVVTHVRHDDRLDSIERRENYLPAVWQQLAIL